MKTVYVLGKQQPVNVQRKYKSIWIAVGEFNGRRIEVRRRSEAEAVAAWIAATNAKEIPAG